MRNLLVTGGAGFIGSNLTLTLQEQFPDAQIVVVDDFRSGYFRNLQGYRGDFVAADVSRLDWQKQFREVTFDTIFHLASITDTTVHDQLLQAHDNIEGFRAVLQFAEPTQTPVVYASSAAVYGMGGGSMKEEQVPVPANIYAFSKWQLDNLARAFSRRNPSWKIVGVRYFNVYGPREAHKGAAASMIYQLHMQMKAGKRPRVFRAGEQKRDFVYVKDVVDFTIQARAAKRNGVYNCGSGQPFSFNEVIQELNRNLGTKLEPEYFENPYSFYQPHTEADLTLSRSELGYVPKFPPATGIADYVAFLEEQTQSTTS
ncbi:MAG: ADP-glyceromanno-heptose 6-epimerase [Verrucomicrobiia bacterium]